MSSNILSIAVTTALSLFLAYRYSNRRLNARHQFRSIFLPAIFAVILLTASWMILGTLLDVSDSLPSLILPQAFVAIAPLLRQKWAQQRSAS